MPTICQEERRHLTFFALYAIIICYNQSDQEEGGREGRVVIYYILSPAFSLSPNQFSVKSAISWKENKDLRELLNNIQNKILCAKISPKLYRPA